MWLILCIFCIFLCNSSIYADKSDDKAPHSYIGSGLVSNPSSGYGLYMVKMKPSSSKGVVSSFFLYNAQDRWPKLWNEIDLEFVPGFVAENNEYDTRVRYYIIKKSTIDKKSSNEKGIESEGNCPDYNLDKEYYLCDSKFINSLSNAEELREKAISFNVMANNVYAYPELPPDPTVSGKPIVNIMQPGDQQVFFIPEDNPYKTDMWYFIAYLPEGIYWSKPLSENNLNDLYSDPKDNILKENSFSYEFNDNQLVINLPKGKEIKSIFYKKYIDEKQYDNLLVNNDNNDNKVYCTVASNTNCELLYYSPNTLEVNNDLGKQMYMRINIWDGSHESALKYSTALQGFNWGGAEIDENPNEAVYKYIAYFPYDKTNNFDTERAIISDFVKNKYWLYGKEASFDLVWRSEVVNNVGADIPVGLQSPLNIICDNTTGVSLYINSNGIPSSYDKDKYIISKDVNIWGWSMPLEKQKDYANNDTPGCKYLIPDKSQGPSWWQAIEKNQKVEKTWPFGKDESDKK